MKKLFVIFMGFFAAIASLFAEKREIKNGDICVNVNIENSIEFSVKYDGKEVVPNARIAMLTNKGAFGVDSKLLGVSEKSHSGVIKTVHGTRAEIADNYKEFTFNFENFDLQFRIYCDAVAYRFVSKGEKDAALTVFDEVASYKFDPSSKAYAHIIDGFYHSYESLFTPTTIGNLYKEKMISLPLIVQAKNAKVAILESDTRSYPQMNFTMQTGKSPLTGAFAKYPTKIERAGHAASAYIVRERADYIAQTKADRSFPWRIFLIAENDAVLADNNIVYKLAKPCAIKDTSWIKFGSAAWEWWNNWNLENADFKTGVNLETYKKYIDFAASVKAPFLVVDAGWLKLGEKGYDTEGYGETIIDIPELVKYAKSKNVEVILWGSSRGMQPDYITFLDRVKNWGIAGLKIDFMDRDDQNAMDFFENVARAAAERKLVLDYHGCPKPVGLDRTYPNIVNYEGVLGNEWNKWSDKQTPRHKIDLVFTRMLCGPMDFTPGAMRRQLPALKKPEQVIISKSMPFGMGTLCNEMALYVLYYAPCQMLCDTPTEYQKKMDVAEFIAQTPTVWDNTKVLNAKFGEYVAIARQSGKNWYIGAITDKNAQNFKIDLDFLDEGQYEATVFADSVNCDKDPNSYTKKVLAVKKGDTLKLNLAKFGGAAVKIVKK